LSYQTGKGRFVSLETEGRSVFEAFPGRSSDSVFLGLFGILGNAPRDVTGIGSGEDDSEDPGSEMI
jgi:hypothetical protein